MAWTVQLEARVEGLQQEKKNHIWCVWVFFFFGTKSLHFEEVIFFFLADFSIIIHFLNILVNIQIKVWICLIQQSFQNNSPNKCLKGLPSWLPSGNTCCSCFGLLTVAKCLLKEDCLIIFYNVCPSWACHADYPKLTYIGSFSWNIITAVFVSMQLLDDCRLNVLLWEVICHNV